MGVKFYCEKDSWSPYLLLLDKAACWTIVMLPEGAEEGALFAETFGFAENFGHYFQKVQFYTFYCTW